jgi:hypothetical protein
MHESEHERKQALLLKRPASIKKAEWLLYSGLASLAFMVIAMIYAFSTPQAHAIARLHGRTNDTEILILFLILVLLGVAAIATCNAARKQSRMARGALLIFVVCSTAFFLMVHAGALLGLRDAHNSGVAGFAFNIYRNTLSPVELIGFGLLIIWFFVSPYLCTTAMCLIFSKASNAWFRGLVPQEASQVSHTAQSDCARWSAAIEHDHRVAMIAEKLRSLGPKWSDEFISSYLALTDKSQLPELVRQLIERAKKEDAVRRL